MTLFLRIWRYALQLTVWSYSEPWYVFVAFELTVAGQRNTYGFEVYRADSAPNWFWVLRTGTTRRSWTRRDLAD